MDQELSGKVAVITGGANGLGLATAERFVQAGAKVVIGDLDEAAGAAAEAASGGAIRFLRTDVSDDAQLQALCDLAVSAFGGLDIMYNNAAVPNRVARLLDDDLGDFDRTFDVNVRATITGTQIAGRHMRERGGGVILNATSIAAGVPSFGLVCYRVSKAAVLYFTKAAAIELAEYNIRVNALMPGQIQTDILKKALAQQVADPELLEEYNSAVREIMASYQPLRRQGVPTDIAEAALFLASDRAAYITGVVLPVDGGITAGDAHNYVEKFGEARDRILNRGKVPA